MNIPVREPKVSQKLAIVDCDIHPAQRAKSDLHPFLSARWREHMETFGGHIRQGLWAGQNVYPRMMAGGRRKDAFPPGGGPPGSDLDTMRRQLLDAYGIEVGMLVCGNGSGMEERNLDYGAALAHAVNEWQLEAFVLPEPRLRAGIVVPQENADAAVAEIELRADDRSFSQVIMSPRSAEPLGRQKYWPIFAAAEHCNIPIGLHQANINGGHPSTGSGWPTYYMQEHYAFMPHLQSVVSSLIIEGVFEKFPNLKVAIIEAGYTWAPALGWRMDKHWERMRKEVPHIKRPPSEYLREHIWFTTQPIEEPDDPAQLVEMFDWIGWDRMLFSTDYPHWDFDDPQYAIKFKMSDAQKQMLMRDNARALYRLA
jgi:predicted TIM-barrel fold metal-dependent hydrolase